MNPDYTELPPEGTDSRILAQVDQLSIRELEQFSVYIPRDLKHYVALQRGWIEKAVFYLGLELGRQPTPNEIANRVLTGRHSKRFRAFYALKFGPGAAISEESGSICLSA
jgi:hypothetical protein